MADNVRNGGVQGAPGLGEGEGEGEGDKEKGKGGIEAGRCEHRLQYRRRRMHTYRERRARSHARTHARTLTHVRLCRILIGRHPISE